MLNDIIILGGGIIGASAAYRLAQAGLRVLLLEKHHPGFGASGCSAAMLECQTDAYRGDRFLSLALPSLRLFPNLADEILALTGLDFEYERCGIWNLALNQTEAAFLKDQVAAQRARGLKAEWVDTAALMSHWPQLDPENCGAAFYAEDGQVNGEKFLQAMLAGARQEGAQIRELAAPIQILWSETHDRRVVTGVRLGAETLSADQVILAGGAWTDQVLEPLGVRLGVRPLRGQLLFFETPHRILSAPLYTRQGFYAAPKNGFTIVGTTVEEVGFNADTTPEAREKLLGTVRRLLPGLARTGVRGMSAGLRPATTDTFPFLGRLMGVDGLIIAAGHFRNGMLLAPITADIVRALVMGRTTPVDLSPFSPDRISFAIPTGSRL